LHEEEVSNLNGCGDGALPVSYFVTAPSRTVPPAYSVPVSDGAAALFAMIVRDWAISSWHYVRMKNVNTLRLPLRRGATDGSRWHSEAAAHYRQLAAWLREIAGKSRLPNPQRELLSLVRRYEMRADHLDRSSRYGE
jgi:hypothetical protein